MQRVVVIGGGFAGSLVAKKLQRFFDVTLVDTKEYFEFTPGILRTLVRFGHLRRIQALHTKYLGRARVIVGAAERISGAAVHLASGQVLEFDYLVVATGSRYASPIKDPAVVQATRADVLHRCYHQLEDAGRVLVVGGGLVGVELAAEVACRYPRKVVTLAHALPELLERNAPSVRGYAARFLVRRGVRIAYNEMVLGKKGNVFTTKAGTRIEADLTFMCTGIVPNSEVASASFPGCTNQRGFVKVEPTLQLPSHPNLFVVGDVNDCGVEKTAQNARLQAALVAGNIKALAAGRSLQQYVAKPTPMVISLGPWHGIYTSGNLAISGVLPSLLKAAIELQVMFSYRS